MTFPKLQNLDKAELGFELRGLAKEERVLGNQL